MNFGRFVAICATSGLTMFNVFLLVMLLWSVNVASAQQFDNSLEKKPDVASASAAVIQANNEKRVRNLNGVTNKNGHAVPPPVQRAGVPMSGPEVEGEATSLDSLDELMNDEGYWREIKAIIGGVLGFWGGVGGLGTMFLVIVLSQRYCCKKDDDKDDGDG